MADVPATDAGLGSGITNVSQQVGGALGLAVLGTVATNHTNSLLAQHHALASSLVSGYHLAFAIAAACVAIGIVSALAVLRTPSAREIEPAPVAEPARLTTPDSQLASEAA
jgi:hypothetical protein